VVSVIVVVRKLLISCVFVSVCRQLTHHRPTTSPNTVTRASPSAVWQRRWPVSWLSWLCYSARLSNEDISCHFTDLSTRQNASMI